MTNVTICTFNVQNLFARYKKFLEFGGAAHSWNILKPEELPEREGLFLPGTWVTDAFDLYKEENKVYTAQAIMEEVRPDILFLQEVESMETLRRFNENFLGREFGEMYGKKDGYAYPILIDSTDPRRIDVAVLTDHKIESMTTHIYEFYGDTTEMIFSRDCLEINFSIDGKPLTAYVTHLKSQYGDDKDYNNNRRLKQAETVRDLVRSRFGKKVNGEWKLCDDKDFVLVGDLNDSPSSKFLAPIIKELDMYNVIETLPKEEQWTHLYRDESEVSQLDHILVSPHLKNNSNSKARVERRFLPNRRIKKVTLRDRISEKDNAYKKVIDYNVQRYDDGITSSVFASDHCPVFYTLTI
jgi:endonuclease/exonuclease/phosphatase family metal-dependent hydrolase